MKAIIFLVDEAPEGGYTAKTPDLPIFTEADDFSDLREKIRDAVNCHFDKGEEPKLIRLHVVREDLMAV